MNAGRPLGTDDSTPFRDETDPYQAFVRSMQQNKATGPAKPPASVPSGKSLAPEHQALIMMILQMLLSKR